ncbi:multidrug resistance efflux transporter family protein [Bacillus songklensis]|uniref:Multidrug resistance efflux transporter family protein n=1 Tax=Bacillus songklensis TaxID=1069116 RepID=A0ABV8B8J1_9BACI
MKPIVYGLLASFFFAFTFIFNRAMEIEGGSWMWSASLRYIFMVPILWAVVGYRGGVTSLVREMRQHPFPWFLWSFVGFVLFYAPLTFAASFGPGWLIASTWQLVIIAGILLTPLFYKLVETASGPVLIREKLPVKGLLMSSIILLGVIFMQIEHAESLSFLTAVGCVATVMVAAFAYPLGNRKMMEMCGERLDAFQRTFGMTLATFPFWLILAGCGYVTEGAPSASQMIQSLIVAVSAGLIATVLFFWATDMVKANQQKLAAVEATQAGAVIFTLAGEVWFLSTPLPSFLSWMGIILVMSGMVLHSFLSRQKEEKIKTETKELTF